MLDVPDTIKYENLVLAPGATPRRLPVEGVNLGNVFTLRQVEDAKVIDAGTTMLICALVFAH